MDDEKQLKLVSLNEVEAEEYRNYIPVGYRFFPTDYEVFKNYLFPKVHGKPILSWFIYEVDVYKYEPTNLPGLKRAEKTFYFTPRESKNGYGKRPNRCANGGQGYWKTTSKLTQLKDDNGSILGKKNTLVYFIKNIHGKDFKTNFIMHEYVLDQTQTVPTECNQFNNVVLCSIYQRESAAEKNEAQAKKESQQTASKCCAESSPIVPTKRYSTEDVQQPQPQPPSMLKRKRPLVEEHEPQPLAYQNKRFRPLEPWNNNAYENTFEFGEPSQVFEPDLLQSDNLLEELNHLILNEPWNNNAYENTFEFGEPSQVFEPDLLQSDNLLEELNHLILNELDFPFGEESQKPSQVFQAGHQLQCGSLSEELNCFITEDQKRSQQPASIGDNINELASIVSSSCMLESQKTSLGNATATGFTTHQRPMRSSLREKKDGHEKPLNYYPLPSIPSSISEFLEVQPPPAIVGWAPTSLEESYNDQLFFQDFNFCLDGD